MTLMPVSRISVVGFCCQTAAARGGWTSCSGASTAPLPSIGSPEHVEHASQRRFADRHVESCARCDSNLVAAAQALARGEHDAAHGVAADVLRDLHRARLSVSACNGRALH